MRLMLLCCTWKDERMGEEEGEEPAAAAGLFVCLFAAAGAGGAQEMCQRIKASALPSFLVLFDV